MSCAAVGCSYTASFFLFRGWQTQSRALGFCGTEWNRFGCGRVGKCLKTWWPGTELNRRRQPFQGCALPTELPGHWIYQASFFIVAFRKHPLPELELGGEMSDGRVKMTR